MWIRNLFKYWTYQLVAPGTVLKERYAAFKSLLTHDKRAHELMADLEEIFYRRQKRDFCALQALTAELSKEVGAIVADLERVCPARYLDLKFFYHKIDAYIRYMTDPLELSTSPPYTLALTEIGVDDRHRVGGKTANLAGVKNILGFPVPKGFAITTAAQELFFKHNGLRERIEERLAALDGEDAGSVEATAEEIQALILAGEVPASLKAALAQAGRSMDGGSAGKSRLALRSSAVGEDGQASFAGQFLSVLHVKPQAVIDTYKEVLAGKYAPEAIAYRIRHGIGDQETPMAVLVLEMVAAVSSGVVYTADLHRPKADQMTIHAIWGLGEFLVSGQTPADRFTVTKRSPHAILESKIAHKPVQVVGGDDGGTVSRPLSPRQTKASSMEAGQVAELARMAAALETHYGCPQDIEWAMDAEGTFFILQSRPLKSDAALEERPTCTFIELPERQLLEGGERAAGGIAAGPVFNMRAEEALQNLPRGAILVAAAALPRYARAMDRVGAVVTEAGSTAGHLATVAREYGVPMLVNAEAAGDLLTHGETVTVHADAGAVYAGRVDAMLASPCARDAPVIDTPFRRKLAYILTFVATLDLVDPQSASFTPRHCRSFHDIIRFAHEKAVQEMFHISDNRLRKLGSAKKLSTDIPMLFYLLDVGGGLRAGLEAEKEIPIEAVRNRAMRALWRGLSHPDIEWGGWRHFDWEAHDRMVMSGGIASPEAAMFASHAVISDDYMNLNLRFGYHFVIVDALLAAAEQTVLFRFSGGGADLGQRMLRARFLSRILRRLGFDVSVKSDLIDGQYKGRELQTTLGRLDMVGRLLGATRLMDMYLKDAGQIDGFVEDFMGGRYHFASVELE
ncbi:MAG: PEP/pyruvate-binding domain-containing protein [Desulfosarcinaceae bacterium]